VTEQTDSFFSTPNEIVPSQLQAGLGDLLHALRERLDNRRLRTLLPARVSGTTRWYGIAPSHREGRLLRDEVKCWLSRPLTTGLVDVPRTSSDAMDQAALRLVPEGSVTRVEIAPGWVEEVRRNVDSLIDIWAIEPDRSVDEPRPVGRVLRQFYECLVGNDRPQAEAALDELRERALLSATNLRFLRVELLSSLGTPSELIEDPYLRDISLLARPAAVTVSLAEAVDATLISPALDSEEADLRGTAERLDFAWPALVTQVYQVTTPATARCYALGQLLLDRPKWEQLRELSIRYPSDVVLTGVLAENDLNPPPPAEQPAKLGPLNSYYEGDYQGALDAVVAQAPSRSGAAVALAAAVNLKDSAAAIKALAVVDQLPDAVRTELLESAVERSLFESLRAMTSDDQVPKGWLDWLNNDWPDRPDLLAEWSRQWTQTPFDIAAIADELAEALIYALNDERRARVRNGLPVLVDWLIAGTISPSLLGLATTIFEIMLSSDPGRLERQAALSLFDEVLAAGCTAKEYRELLGAIVNELSVIGPRDGQWLAQVLDLVMISACPDSTERTALISRAVGVAKSWADRLDDDDALVLRLVFRDAGIELLLSSKAAPSAQEASNIDSVGVYSLMESAIRVFATWIGEQWPDMKVKASSAEVNSAALASLVKGVDVMLVQTSHAKHSATIAINMAIVDPRRLVLVHGRGASALMRALLEWIEAK